ncbi:hypothetical protein [Poseidonibacter sp.]|uniref:hypothetical protein n=1 Tax=Poseidonibacter sp. TaxID=2321188 RepID=UPI003C739B6A
MNVGYAIVSISSQNLENQIEAAKKKSVQFGRKAILSTKEKNIIYKVRKRKICCMVI